jgi:hypothetical protein
LCGGGDDISTTATAAIGIAPHTNFDTVLSSTVSSAGTYYFHLNVLFGSDSSEAIRSFTAVSAPVTPPVTPPSGGGGGGGGGTPPKVDTDNYGIADLNNDGKVNSVDFSILLYYWKAKAPFKNTKVDINKDSRVDSVDFSILLYWWDKKLIK